MYDYVVIGSGIGGSVITRRLVERGGDVCLLERGDFVKQEESNWDVHEIAVKKKYQSGETWYDKRGKPFNPRTYYNVGGSTRFYGAAAFRLRREDFEERLHEDGISPRWPFSYDAIKPYYDEAEALLGVHGQRGEDPTDPEGKEYPHPPIEHEPFIADLADRLKRQGLRPFHTPLAIDFGPGGRCRKGSPCDGFPCFVRAKGDAENRVLRPLLLKKPDNLTLITGARAERILTDNTGTTVRAVRYSKDGQTHRVEGRTIILAAGALNSPLILLDSKTEQHPQGLGNSSGLVGRNYLCHNSTVLIAFHPFRRNPTKLQKTLSCNDFYLSDGEGGLPLGNIQLRGKIQPDMLRNSSNPLLRILRRFIARRSADFWIMSEDLPDRDNRIYRNGESRVCLERTPTNTLAHSKLVSKVRRILKRCGFPLVFTVPRGINSVQHQSGTLRMGSDPAGSVLDQYCRVHDLENLFVVDGGFFPSSGAVNPALTIAAQSLRVADHIGSSDAGPDSK